MIDIGVNLTNKRFDKDCKEVLSRAREAGITELVITGTSLESSTRAIELVKACRGLFPGLYTTAGIHPHDASTCNPETLRALKSLIADNRNLVVAVGETGLDFNRNYSPAHDQTRAFERQIELAIDTNLPLFLHEREASQRQLDILGSYGDNLPKAVIHCFTGNRQTLHSYLDRDLWIGITGWICDERRGTELQSFVAEIPPDKMMVETDAPYLLPRTIRPRPKSNRNEPAYLPFIIDMIARCSGKTAAEIRQNTSATARAFFGI